MFDEINLMTLEEIEELGKKITSRLLKLAKEDSSLEEVCNDTVTKWNEILKWVRTTVFVFLCLDERNDESFKNVTQTTQTLMNKNANKQKMNEFNQKENKMNISDMRFREMEIILKQAFNKMSDFADRNPEYAEDVKIMRQSISEYVFIVIGMVAIFQTMKWDNDEEIKKLLKDFQYKK